MEFKETKKACSVAPLPYYGGKQAQGKAKWIASLLPWEKNSVYVEPFGGMMSVLLHRQPVKTEIYNDIDGDVVNWWTVLRHNRDEFAKAVECIPHSREMFEWACSNYKNQCLSSFDRALAFHTVCLQSIYMRKNKLQWRLFFSPNVGSMGRWRSERVELLAERIWKVQLDNRPADFLLNKLSDNSVATVYCDPPYDKVDNTPYDCEDLDVDLFSDIFNCQKGNVAISGYGDTWDHLGWERHEKKAIVTLQGEFAYRKSPKRTEVLWTNYNVPEKEMK